MRTECQPMMCRSSRLAIAECVYAPGRVQGHAIQGPSFPQCPKLSRSEPQATPWHSYGCILNPMTILFPSKLRDMPPNPTVMFALYHHERRLSIRKHRESGGPCLLLHLGILAIIQTLPFLVISIFPCIPILSVLGRLAQFGVDGLEQIPGVLPQPFVLVLL